jgi:hypothetical protein
MDARVQGWAVYLWVFGGRSVGGGCGGLQTNCYNQESSEDRARQGVWGWAAGSHIGGRKLGCGGTGAGTRGAGERGSVHCADWCGAQGQVASGAGIAGSFEGPLCGYCTCFHCQGHNLSHQGAMSALQGSSGGGLPGTHGQGAQLQRPQLQLPHAPTALRRHVCQDQGARGLWGQEER